ncbi:uncharacterized protein LOC111044833 isoform X5 [Nilaparvata lugens]|uniref:uncharacterized protein LOC111044833 isoform X5 n=1 Tax=Nilaparvata lugens TaxID=108931 RepID=UPI00193D7AD3|nr:uncharacterized protein LOC111044833 isoform X5 [Nilaparvata lugens]
MDTGFNDLKYFPEEELENIIAEVRKKRQQKWENHLASKSLALGSSNIDQMMEIFQSERKNNSEVVAEVSSNIHDIERTDYCQCRDNGCECIKDKIVKDCDIDEKRSPIKEKKTATSSKNKIKRIHALLLPEEILFRLRNILKRLVTSLEQFKKHITKQKNDEEDEDNERKMKRANEFVSWFSRNYLYQLKRQLDLLKNERNSKFDDLYKKFYLSFQTTVQAIQACLKSSAHSSIAPCKKIDEFLKETMALYDYCIEELKPSPELEKMKSLTNEACKLLEEHVQALEKAEAAVRAKAQHKKRTVKQPKSNVPKKLSMYCSSSLPKECWEKKSSKLARKKFGPPKPKNAPAKSSKVSPKPSERSLGDKQEKLPLRGNGKEEDLAIPLLLPCDSGKRFELFLLANTMTELEKLRGKMDKEEGANNGSNEETVKETLQKIAKQINEIYKSSSDFNENLLDKNAPEDKGDVANSKLICMKHDENYQKKQRKIEYNKDGIISEDGKSLCIPFCIDDETIESCKRYRCEFEEYKNSLCCDPDGFLNLVERSADSVILKLIDSIAEEMEEGMSLLTNKLYELELKEVCS